MRRHLIALCIPMLAHAAPATVKVKPIDVSAASSKLGVYRDELGTFYVMPTPGQWDKPDEAEQFLFIGDGKSMWRQRVIGYSSEVKTTGPELEWSVWAPRAKHVSLGTILASTDHASVQCSTERKDDRKLVQLHADEAKAFFAHATFYPELWQRQSRFLARDDDGTYYFVDMFREDYGGAGYRVFVGPKGALKELPMTNVVTDSAGDIYATKGGQLKIIVGSDSYWIKGGRKTTLTVLDPRDNVYLIYRELGIYGPLGAACDDL